MRINQMQPDPNERLGFGVEFVRYRNGNVYSSWIEENHLMRPVMKISTRPESENVHFNQPHVRFAGRTQTEPVGAINGDGETCENTVLVCFLQGMMMDTVLMKWMIRI